MNLLARIASHKQILTTAGITTAAFLVALPIGAAVLPNGSTADAQGSESTITRTVTDLGSCTTGTSTGSATKTVTTASKKVTPTNTHTNTQNSSNNSGSTAQVGHNGIATAVTVGDVLSNNNIPVLSNNNVSVPVLSNNTTTVSPSVNVLSNNSDTGLLGLGLLGLL